MFAGCLSEAVRCVVLPVWAVIRSVQWKAEDRETRGTGPISIYRTDTVWFSAGIA
jgi:hypothetical protein